MRAKTPPLYATGRWQLRAPFQINPSKVYTCRTIRSYVELKESGIDVYRVYYLPQGLSQTDYENDARNLGNIVVLMAPGEPTVTVPDAYILAYPDVSTIPYRHTVLSISLGAIPPTVPLGDLKQKIEEYALASLGLHVQIKTHQAGELRQEIDQATHLLLEQNRLAALENNETTYTALHQCQAEMAILREQNQLLMELVNDNNLLN